MLSFSRWYFRDRPGEMYRLTSLATASLKDMGVQNPRDHIMIVRRMFGASEQAAWTAQLSLAIRPTTNFCRS